MNSGIENQAANHLGWKLALLLAGCCTILCGCGGRQLDSGPHIQFTRVPLADEGGPEKLDLIEGRVNGVGHAQQIVVFARSGAWYVQPFANDPFTQIQADSKWRTATHLGTEYAALLVEPGYQPPSSTSELPGVGGGVVAVTTTKGEPLFWKRWWFVLLCVLAFMSVLLVFYSYRLRERTRQMGLRFEERLAERNQIAQELHDTLLQGVISASMQLEVAVDRVPESLPAKPALTHVLHVMAQVLDEGRKALQRLGSIKSSASLDVEEAFYRIKTELTNEEQISFRVTVEGRPRLVHPIIRDEVYRIGRDALLKSVRYCRAKRIHVEVKYKARYLRIVLRDDGDQIAGPLLLSGHADQRGLSDARERAERVGARLKVRQGAAGETETELTVPGQVAFQSQPPKTFEVSD